MNSFQFQQILAAAMEVYLDVLSVLAETLRQNTAALGLLAPGHPAQLALNNGNGVTVTSNGWPIFRAVAMRRNRSSIRGMCSELQGALDAMCYGAGLDRLYVLWVQMLPGGYVGITLTWGCW